VTSVLGVGVVLGLMAFGFFGMRVAKVVAVAGVLVSAPFFIGLVHDYRALSGALVAYAVSTLVCWAMSANQTEEFDFSVIAQRVGDYDVEEGPVAVRADDPDDDPDYERTNE
jgi:hypothetical protein